MSTLSTCERPPDYRALCDTCLALAEAFPERLQLCALGRSLLGRSIPYLMFGKGSETVLYVGAHHGMEWITSLVLLRFAEDFQKSLAGEGSVCGVNIPFLYRHRRFIVIPTLNVDGVDIQINGVSEDCILRDRLLRMNEGSPDFSHWQANARGVDLNHNYREGFEAYKALEQEQQIVGGQSTLYSGEYPESEPEVAALATLVRILHPRIILTLHTQGEEIYWGAPNATPQMYRIGKKLAAMTGYRLASAEGTAAYGGLTDWAVAELGIPSYTLECGLGVNPLPLSQCSDIYITLKEALFHAPIL
ncbi:MAG: M14 family metallocarboxypeptidase [Eubacteriales bacterium]